jgi:hypothetical protein
MGQSGRRCQRAGTASDTEGEVLDSRSLAAYVDRLTGARRPAAKEIPRLPAWPACCACVSELDRVSLVGDVLVLTGRRPALHAGSQRSGAHALFRPFSLHTFSSFLHTPPPWALLVYSSVYPSPSAGSFPVPPANGAPSCARLRAHQRGSRDSLTACASLTAASAAVAASPPAL